MLDPRFELPNRRRLAIMIADLRTKLRSYISAEITGVEKLSIILDIWSKKGLSESYMGVLAKYLKPHSSEIGLALLSLRKLEGSHTADNIHNQLQSILLDWGINDDKIMYYVTDNGSNIVSALKECIIEYAPLAQQEEMTEEDEMEFGIFEGDTNLDASVMEDEASDDLLEFDRLEEDHNSVFSSSKRLGCIAHQIACVMRKCVDKSSFIRPIVISAFKLVKAITKSTLNKELLLKYNGRGLLSPSQTRWVYTYYVIDRLIESKEAVEKVIVERDLADVAIDPLKWKQLGHIRDLLKPFADVVRELEGDRYSTISQVIPALIDIIEIMDDRVKISRGFGNVACDLKQELERRFSFMFNKSDSNFQPAYLLATFFDPRYIIGLTNDQRDLCVELIIKSLSKQDASVAVHHTASAESSSSSVSGQMKYFGFFKRCQQQASSTTTDDRVHFLKTKLDGYITERVEAGMPASEGVFSPLQYWFLKRDSFKEIASYALHLLLSNASFQSLGSSKAADVFD